MTCVTLKLNYQKLPIYGCGEFTFNYYKIGVGGLELEIYVLLGYTPVNDQSDGGYTRSTLS